ncbi:Crp/Fnr family transcriptional regulator [Methylobacterium sp.]|uniref:Crp/Fnr family transcriptional regulator n=1 Tax=Methylobacterium sp. TaxID=409 RepID=UPI0025D7BB7D|nr:Crp/Fnr family transcriptional regulator [Methylobacterium sp.]
MDALIRKLGSIATFSAEERQAIERLPVNVRMLHPRQDIVRDGSKPSQCCLLLSGWACRYKLLRDGRRQILSFHIPGDIPDLQSLQIPTMDHSVATLTEAKVAFISHESLRGLTECFPGIGEVLTRCVLLDAATFREWMVGMGRRDAFEAIAHLLCELYLKLQAVGLAENYRFSLPFTQTDLGDALGLSYVHVNRVLQEMRGKSLITLRCHILEITGWDELLRIAEFDATYLHLEQRAAG